MTTSETEAKTCTDCDRRPTCAFMARVETRQLLQWWTGAENLASACRFYSPKISDERKSEKE